MRYLFLFICMISGLMSRAQLKGLVKDEKGKGLASATVSLFNAKDSLLSSTTSMEDGSFIIQNPEGSRVLRLSMTGRTLLAVQVSSATTDLGSLTLMPSAAMLGAVQVTARRPPVEYGPGKTTVNIESSLNNTGRSALEVLESTPGVYVDKDGNISLHGKKGITVMLDGKPSYLSGEQLKNYLAAMPASALEQIELMDHPSARFDAAGTAGVINLKTKRNKREGLFGQLTLNASAGKVNRGNVNSTLGYQSGKWSFNSNFTLAKNYQYQTIDIRRRIYGANGLQADFSQISNFDHPSYHFEGGFSADYQISKKTSLNTGFKINGHPGTFENNNVSLIRSGHGSLDSSIKSYSRNDDLWRSKTTSLGMRHKLDTVGTELSADFTWLSYDVDNSQSFVNSSFRPDESPLAREELAGRVTSDLDVVSGRMDFVHPIKNGKMEAGLKQSHVTTDNGVFYQNVVNSVKFADYTRSNNFLYREDLSAAYVDVEQKWKKLSVKAGLRYEYVRYDGWQHGNPVRSDSSFKRTYDNLFPTLFLSYDLDDNHKISLASSRRIDRPAYETLNPFLFYLDKYTYVAGNPFIRPQYSTSVELAHDYRNWLHTAVSYTHVKDVRNQVMEEAPVDFATILREQNIGRSRTLNVSSSARLQPFKWWTMNLYGQYSYVDIYGDLGRAGIVQTRGGMWSFNGSEQFQWGKHWQAELSGFYNTRIYDGQLTVGPFGMLNAAVGYKMMEGRASLKLTVRDVFYTGINGAESRFGSTVVNLRMNSYTRNVLLNFTYRFGKQKRSGGGRRSAADEEAGRVKMG